MYPPIFGIDLIALYGGDLYYSRTITIALSLSLLACGGGITNTYDDTGPIIEADPNIELLDDVVEFAQAEELGKRQTASFTIQNTGEGTLTVSDIAIMAPFSVGIGSFTVASGASAQVSVYFEPAQYGETEGYLTILSDDPDSPTVDLNLVGSVNTDRDADGYDLVEAGGDDCNDLDDSIYPGAHDEYYDGIDADCAGDNDFDQDKDGFEAEYYNPDTSSYGGDCNDVVDWIYPGAEDDWYDGVDSDCNGANDWDSDGDGYGSAVFGMGQDCDDYDSDVYPNAPERFNNKLDDCNGNMDIDVLPSSAGTSWIGTGSYQGVGQGILATDLDSDGVDDMIIGAPFVGGSGGYGQGSVFMFLSAVNAHGGQTQIGAAWNSFQGDNTDSGLGASLELLDWDGTGSSTVAVGAPGEDNNSGAIYLIEASDLYSYGDTSDAHTKVEGNTGYGYYVGYNMVPNLDLNGDGASDLLFEYVTSSSAQSGNSNIGLLYGGSEGVITMDSLDARWSTNSVGSNPSRQGLSEGGDVDGDGIDDWVFSDPDYDVNFENDGAVFVLWGDTSEYASSGDSFTNDVSIVATSRKYSRGGYFTSIIPDLDGDGLQEIAWSEKASGNVYILSGADASSGGVFEGGDSIAVMEYSESWTPSMIRTVADLDDDGNHEWYVSISGSSSSAAGRVYVYNGTGISGVVENNTDLYGSLKGSADDFDVEFGNSVTTGDLDGDGRVDMIISDPNWEYDVDGDGNENIDAGAVYLFWNL